MESMLSRDPSSRGVDSMSGFHSGLNGPEHCVVQRGNDMNEHGFPLHARSNAQDTRYVGGLWDHQHHALVLVRLRCVVT
eukprot:6491345-Amphidinium_carterae.3